MAGNKPTLINKIVDEDKLESPPSEITDEWIRIMTATTPVDVLGFQVIPGSTDEIRKAYRRLTKELHPDKIRNLPDGWRDLANQAMVKLTDAYSDLTGAGKRPYQAD